MDLTEVLAGVVGYNRRAPKNQPSQVHLQVAATALLHDLPPLGYKVLASGKAQALPEIPWLAILDPDVTKTAKSGIYVVYLFDTSVSKVYLTLNQGVTAHVESFKASGLRGANQLARDALAYESKAIRAKLDPNSLQGLLKDIDLNATGALGQAYEAGTIAAVSYTLSSLPSEEKLRTDLKRMLDLYTAVITAKKLLVQENPQTFQIPAEKMQNSTVLEFKPKSADEYLSKVEARLLKKTRKHEMLVADLHANLSDKGFVVGNNRHPEDLSIDNADGPPFIVEVKIVHSNTEHAVREAIGQLFTYEYVLHPYEQTNKVAAFSEPIGVFEGLLEKLDIASIWLNDKNSWSGSQIAQDWNLV